MTSFTVVLNCGSSSIKFALFDAAAPDRHPAWNGKVQGIGGPAPDFGASTVPVGPLALGTEQPYTRALQRIREEILRWLDGRPVAAVAHRVVHGGARYQAPVRVDAQVLAELKALVPLAPLHQPFALEAMEILLREQPDLPQVACFDTAFHRSLPLVEQVLPLPYAAFERGLRRYGFHGLSYEYMALALDERFGAGARGRTVVAHLGSGASLCGMLDLKSVATTMGFSALDGLMMGTRTGALDPGAVLYLMEIEKLTLQQVGRVLYHESGLLGASGISADPRELLACEADAPRAALALALYVRRAVREIGSMAAALGGLDLLVFTAGVGEHSVVLRQRICAALGWLGVALDDAANARHAGLISAPASAVRVAVVPTNEEWIAARHAQEVLAPL
jgi:acetate kinase